VVHSKVAITAEYPFRARATHSDGRGRDPVMMVA